MLYKLNSANVEKHCISSLLLTFSMFCAGDSASWAYFNTAQVYQSYTTPVDFGNQINLHNKYLVEKGYNGALQIRKRAM